MLVDGEPPPSPTPALGPQRSGARRRIGPWIGAAALAVLIFYTLAYPLFGYRVALGSDTPVYVWWARWAGADGIGAFGTAGRPALVGLVAALSRITGVPGASLTAAFAPAEAVALALAMAAFVDAALGPNPPRSILTVLVGGTFLAFMVAGYLSTLAYGAVLMAALACLVHGLGHTRASASRDGPRWAVGAAAVLVGASGLMHLQFLALTAVVLIGGGLALLPAWHRDAALGVPIRDRALTRVAAAGLGGAALAGAGFLPAASGRAGHPRLDTSRDAFLRRTHGGGVLADSYRRKLRHDFPWYRVATFAGLSMVPLLPAARASRRGSFRGAPDGELLLWGVVLAWLVATLGSVVLLVAGVLAPAQRLAAFCLPVPILGAFGLTRLHANRPGRLAAAGMAAAVAVFVAVAWLAWSKQKPLIAPGALTESRVAGGALGTQPAGTPLILIADHPGDKPSLFITRYANYLRDAVPPDRIPDVQVFVGAATDLLAGRPTLTGGSEHDRLARDSWAQIRPLLSHHPIGIVIQAFDPPGYRIALQLIQGSPDPSSHQLGPGVLVLPGFGLRFPPPQTALSRPAAQRLPGAGPMSPWLPVWLAPLVLLLLTAVGLAWAHVVVRDAEPGTWWMLAPAMGMAAVGLAAITVDAMGFRLDAAGGPIAVALATAGGIATAALRRRNRARGTGGDQI